MDREHVGTVTTVPSDVQHQSCRATVLSVGFRWEEEEEEEVGLRWFPYTVLSFWAPSGLE
jgi:hypothetical protein